MLGFRSIVFKRAYTLQAQGMPWAKALKVAWKRYRYHKEFWIAKIQNRIHIFDKYYHYSDDPRVRRRGQAAEEQIKKDLEMFPWIKNKVLTGIDDPDKVRRFR